MAEAQPLPGTIPVLIAGGGPVGLTLAALLARQGVRCIVAEADAGTCSGSRAICISRRSQEILWTAGAGAALAAKALPWTGGRSYWREREVLHFEMPHEPAQRFAPMVNLQQYHVEAFVHAALQGAPGLVQVAWSTRVERVQPLADAVLAELQGPTGRQTLRAEFLVACDGGRSTVREQLGLQLEGSQYAGRYVIVDIAQKTKRPVERLAWFDPPSHPGSTLLMHRQPDEIWRIDYQLRDGEDATEALRPHNILPRVDGHLRMIGETEPWQLLWASMYEARCLTLPAYRQGRVLFAGDAAHLLPIFGVRGLNSGLEDAANLAWKLALVLEGGADAALLDSYSSERVQAARENIAFGARSTEFMAPPDFAFRLMREATLRLAVDDPAVRPLINPRQSTPLAYAGSPLNGPGEGEWSSDLAAPGRPAPEALLQGPHGAFHLSQCFGTDFTCLVFGDGPLPQVLAALAGHGLAVLDIAPEADALGQARRRYGVPDERAATALVLVRPDGHVLARWRGLDPAPVLACLRARGLRP